MVLSSSNRKPDPEFYKHALHLLNVQASEVVFLDDIGPNLKAAQKLGITTIRESREMTCELSRWPTLSPYPHSYEQATDPACFLCSTRTSDFLVPADQQAWIRAIQRLPWRS